MNCRNTIQSIFLFSIPFIIISSVDAQNLNKAIDDEDIYYTDVGNVALTITNFGTIGTRNRYWPDQPSCEYPKGSRIEHLYQGGLWVGAKRFINGSEYSMVSTGVTDRASSSGEGYEFTTEIGAKTLVRSSLSDSHNFQENAISHQDFTSDYSDMHTRVPATGDTILNHQPLGITVHQESYAWNFPFAEYFVILSYTISNSSADTLSDIFVGLWGSYVVRNTDYVRPGTTGYFDYGGNGYDSLARMMYTFEFQSTPGTYPADSYIGIALLGCTPFPANIDSLGDLYNRTYYNAWRYRGSSGIQTYFSPTDDFNSYWYYSRYTRLSQSIPKQYIEQLRTQPGNYTTMLSTGPWHKLAPGDSLQVVFTIVCAKKKGTDLERLDKPEQREDLYEHLHWAQQTYCGEDLNGNNQLDLDEDIVTRGPNGLLYGADGKLTRYVLPTPPGQPRVHTEIDNQRVTIYWDRTSSEDSRDPISGIKDFEGYRVYRSKPGADFVSNENLLLSLSLVGDFDKPNDTVGYNTGFKKILIDTSSNFAGITFPGDTLDNGTPIRYFYRFPPAESEVTQLSGWQYIYGISAYDCGDATNNLPSLESAMTIRRIIAGTRPTSDPSKEIGVYPNPYYTRAYWDGQGERYRKLYFYNLPASATITIYTIAGDIVAQIDHNSSYQGEDIDWFQRYGDRSQPTQFSGGEHAWNLITKYDQALATGLYLFTVKDNHTGTIKRGKFVVIK